MKNILIITNYFPPEIGAASNRISHLAKGLQKHGYSVSVITPLPNYPKGRVFDGYKGKFRQTSLEDHITVYRLWIYANNSKNKLLRLLSMVSYSFSLVWFFLWNTIPKIVIIQSPPLVVGFTSILFLKSKKRKLILNVSDLWPLAGLELGVFKRNLTYKILEKIERYNYGKADLILGQSEEILTHIKSSFPKKDTFLYRNFPKLVPPIIKQNTASKQKISIVYAGLLGVAQGIYQLSQELDYYNIEFHIYGVGSEQKKIEQFLKYNPECPVKYHGEISRDNVPEELVKYDLTIIPLINRIYGSVPSKIFEYALLGIPIIYFGGGEGECIVVENELGWVVESGNYAQLNKVISNLEIMDFSLELRKKIQKSAIKYFNFENQFQELIKKI